MMRFIYGGADRGDWWCHADYVFLSQDTVERSANLRGDCLVLSTQSCVQDVDVPLFVVHQLNILPVASVVYIH